MTEFAYRAVVADGRFVDGTVEAPLRETAIAELLAQRLTVLEIAPRRTRSALWSLIAKEIGAKSRKRAAARRLMRRLSLLTGASVSMESALQMIASDVFGKDEATLGRSLLWRLRDGASLSAAMQDEAEAFPLGVAAVVRAGERGGDLATTLARLSERLEKAEAAKREFRSALIYPLFLMVTGIAAVVVVLLAVIPQLEPLFADSRIQPPFMTRVAFWLSEALRRDWPALIFASSALAVASLAAVRAERARDFLDRRALSMPWLGRTWANAEAAALSRTLSAMLDGGVTLPSAIRLCEAAVANRAFRHAVRHIDRQLREGQKFSSVCAASVIWPRLFVQLAAVGEATGRLGAMLNQCADILDLEVERDLARFASALTPALTFLVGGFVAAIVASVMLVMSSLGEALQ